MCSCGAWTRGRRVQKWQLFRPDETTPISLSAAVFVVAAAVMAAGGEGGGGSRLRVSSGRLPVAGARTGAPWFTGRSARPHTTGICHCAGCRSA